MEGVAAPLELLSPCAETVVALAEMAAGHPRVPLRTLLVRDPGALAAFLGLPTSLEGGGDVLPTSQQCGRVLSASILRAAAQSSGGVFADWTTPAASLVYQHSQAVGQLARRLAERYQVNPDRAEIAGMLSVLGWLALHARAEPLPAGLPDEPSVLTRWLARRWPLPEWLRAVLLGLDLPVDANNRLTLVVQAAAGWAQRQRPDIQTPLGHGPAEALALLGVPPHAWDAVVVAPTDHIDPPAAVTGGSAAWLWRAVHASLHSTFSPPERGGTAQVEMEAELLHEQLRARSENEAQRLEALKLHALAEFAAGAAHEINNPLAVISGQAQHLLRTEEDFERAKALERIIGQSHRIHALLRGLLLYARPPAPQRKAVRLGRIIQNALTSLIDLAVERRIQVQQVKLAKALKLEADAALLETAIAALVRNAIEAARTDGWVRIQVEHQSPDRVAIVVENNGPGLTPSQREHLFDPFYSSRSAGRGSGLGLCKAWRIAQLHGGSIEVDSTPGQPTRFALSLPVG